MTTTTTGRKARTNEEHIDSGSLTRRTILSSVAFGTAAVSLAAPAGAQPAPTIDDDISDFVTLSAALTGVNEALLAPLVDPVGMKKEYFGVVSDRVPIPLRNLLAMARSVPSNDVNRTAKIIAAVKAADPDTKFAARSIVLLWYLGAWYDSSELKKASDEAGPMILAPATKLTSAAYTQGWIWKIMQAHPMGYGQQHFGYWKDPPKVPHTTFVGRTTHGAAT